MPRSSPKQSDFFTGPEPIPPAVYFGASTWTYPGWVGDVYSRRYPKTGQTTAMLAEYARYPLFNTVGIDGSFYRPYEAKELRCYAEVLPPGFRCVFKVWELITIRRFASVGAFKGRAGALNPDFLSSKKFLEEVLPPFIEVFREHTGPFVFELQATDPEHRPSTDQFCQELDTFFEALPKELEYCVELRDRELMTPAYFNVLRKYNVAHVYNSWTRMPSITEQARAEQTPTASFAVARLLLKPGNRFHDAVKRFEPYDRLQEALPDVRREAVELIQSCRAIGRPIYVLVNNRLEGNTPATVRAIAGML